MRFFRLAGTSSLLLLVISSTGRPQVASTSGTEAGTEVGIVLRRASGTQLGPQIGVGLPDRGLLSTSMEMSLLALVANTVNQVWVGAYDADFRTAAVVGSLSMSGVLGTRRGHPRGWYAAASAGLTVVSWGAGRWEPRRGSLKESVDPEGTITIFPTTGFGIGREFEAFGGRNRLELRLDRHHDAVAQVDGFRLSVTRGR